MHDFFFRYNFHEVPLVSSEHLNTPIVTVCPSPVPVSKYSWTLRELARVCHTKTGEQMLPLPLNIVSVEVKVASQIIYIQCHQSAHHRARIQ